MKLHQSLASASIAFFLLLASAAVAHASLGGNCKLLAPQFGNPGLGCAGQGAACQINGKAGVCTNMKRKISSLIYCVCSPDGKKPPEEVEAKAVSQTALEQTCGGSATLTIDESAPHIVDIAFAEQLEVVRVEDFSGSVTVSTAPLADDPGHCLLTIESGTFTAPSFTLPDGRSTGLNFYDLGTDTASTGSLDLSTGRYTATASGRITNDLYADLPTDGSYRGTVDFDAGTITIDTTTLDLVDSPVAQPIDPVGVASPQP